MKKLVEFLSGKKTYIFATLIALVVFANTMLWIDDETTRVLLGLFGAGSIASLRAGVAK